MLLTRLIPVTSIRTIPRCLLLRVPPKGKPIIFHSLSFIFDANTRPSQRTIIPNFFFFLDRLLLCSQEIIHRTA